MKFRLREYPLLTAGAGLMLVQAAGGLLAPLVAPYGPDAQDIMWRLKGPGWAHWLGTDNFGRDTLSRILFGTGCCSRSRSPRS